MLPDRITHHGREYDLAHIQQRYKLLTWQRQNGQNVDFKVRIQYSNHCISRAIKEDFPPGAYYFNERQDRLRIFCLDRYKWSLELPRIIGGLLDCPTMPVSLTNQNNWYIFAPTMQHSLTSGEKYYCFLRPRYIEMIRKNPPLHRIRLQVESAYPRKEPPKKPHHNERRMFGSVIEQISP